MTTHPIVLGRHQLSPQETHFFCLHGHQLDLFPAFSSYEYLPQFDAFITLDYAGEAMLFKPTLCGRCNMKIRGEAEMKKLKKKEERLRKELEYVEEQLKHFGEF